MKLTYKRIGILFSVALNIGFVIMATAMALQQSKSAHDRSWSELVGVVEGLGLPPARQDAVLDTIRSFRTTIAAHDRSLYQARNAVLATLARAGSLDHDALHRCTEAVGRQETIKTEAFEVHVIDLRRQLGDEKGALFFSLLLENIQAKHPVPPR